MIIERYKLILTHTIEDEEKILKKYEPKVMEFANTNMEDRLLVGYKNYLINNLFEELRRTVLQEIEDE